MTPKPVYLAGRGFQDEEVRPPRLGPWLWALALLGLLGLAMWWWLRPSQGEAGTCRLIVTSDPPGAEVLLNLNPTALRTPAQVDWPRDEELLVQVRLAGHEADPLSRRLDARELAAESLPLAFTLRLLPAPGRVRPSGVDSTVTPVAAAPPSSTTSFSVKTPPAPLAQAPPVKDPGGHTMGWANWDPAFRLKIDGRLQPGPTQVMTPGSHRLQVDLRGRLLLDTLLHQSGAHRFSLPSQADFVEVTVIPAEGEIVMGDASLGRGRVLLHRAELPVELRFPPLPGLLPPPARTVARNSPARVECRHGAALELSWAPGGGNGLRVLDLGYELEGRYKEDAAHGPRRDGRSLLLGRAFHDRRPGGAQALRLAFDVPEAVNRQWEARLEIDAVDSGRRHPLTLTRGATLSVWLNSTALVKDMPLSMGEAPRSWPVSNLLRPGQNELRIQSSEASRSSTALREVKVRVGP